MMRTTRVLKRKLKSYEVNLTHVQGKGIARDGKVEYDFDISKANQIVLSYDER